MSLRFRLAAVSVLAAIMVSTPPSFGDEGMWLYNAPPLQQLKERYGFEPSQKWLENLQKASVRFNSGGSGSFVSPDGLIMTNHHVGADDIQKLSTPEKDLLKLGFHAKTRAEELKCKGLELNVLQSIKIVTDEVNAVVKEGMDAQAAFQARQAKISELENANSNEEKNIRADVVTLFNGGAYHLYIFKKYTDIRLVFAPEKQIAFFGGDPDNFEYPRFDLDVCFFRAYENDQPAKSEHYLKWSAAGSKEGDLIFVSGHPGRTSRQRTVAELKYLRDFGFPFLLARLNRAEVVLGAWVSRSEENRQKGEDELFGIQNSRKARFGGLHGLLDPKLMSRKEAEEKRLKDFLQAQLNNRKAKTSEEMAMLNNATKAFDTIAEAEKKRAEIIREYTFLEAGGGFMSELFGIARSLLRAGDEIPKPNGERLREYAKARLPALELALFADQPIPDDFEIVKLADSLAYMAGHYGAESDLMKSILAGKSPRERAFELVSSTKVKDVAFRKKLYEGGKTAVDAAHDPMIELARLVDPQSRAVRKVMELEVEEPKQQAYAALSKARFALDGTNTYPDATFTLRLSYGTVKGFVEAGKPVPAYTTIEGLYKRSAEQGNVGPFALPKLWAEKKSQLDLSTPFNFISTADIIGGNSGSPVVNREGEVVGLIFDGNIQSLVLDFIFDMEEARAVSVDSRAIVEALRKVYDATELVNELTGQKAAE